MQWVKRLNEAMEYVESHLTGTIDRERAAQIACCSSYHFQRMFSYMAGVPLSEYIRRRKMTLAAEDLQRGDRVADVAARYGYESPTAFNRAFQAVHGMPPSSAQKPGVPLKAYARIAFQLSVRGPEQIEYRLEEMDAFRVVGFCQAIQPDLEENFAQIPRFWGEVAQSGQIEELLALADGKVPGLLGVSSCDPDTPNFYYIAVTSNAPIPDGMTEFIVPAGKWAIFSGHGPMPTAIQELECRMVTEWMPSSGYEWSKAPDVEQYLNADPQDAKFEVWMPIIRP